MVTQIWLGLSNVFLLRGERPVLVDTGRPSDVPRIVAALRREGVQPTDLAAILLSHGHWDHAGGTAGLKQQSSAPVALHPGDFRLARAGDNGTLLPIGPMARVLSLAGLDRRGFPAFEPELALETGRELTSLGLPIEVVPLPGHTAGSVGLFLLEGEAIVGDTVMGGYLGGRVLPRRATLHYFAEDPRQLRRSLEVLAQRRPRRLYVGHGGPIDGDDFQRRLPSLLAVLPR